MAVCQNLVPLVNIKIAGKWMFIPLKIVLIGIDPTPYHHKLPSSVIKHGLPEKKALSSMIFPAKPIYIPSLNPH